MKFIMSFFKKYSSKYIKDSSREISESLESNKSNLKNIIYEEMDKQLKKRFPDKSMEFVFAKYRKDIVRIRKNLYEKYANKIDCMKELFN